MFHRYSSEDLAAARAVQAAFRRASRHLGYAATASERKRAWEAYRAAARRLRSLSPELLAEAAGELEACRFAAKHARRNPVGAARLRRWSSGV